MLLRDRIEYIYLAQKAHANWRHALSTYRNLRRLHKLAHKPGVASDQELDVNMEGVLIRGYGASQLLHLYKEVFLRKDYAVQIGSQKPLIYDLGSNIGCSIAFFKRHHRNARIVGFEPHPVLFPTLQLNMERNAYKDVELHNCGLGLSKGKIPFFVSHNPGSLRASTRSDRGGEKQIEVQIELLSTFLAQEEKVDLLKIDVEGAEQGIIQDLINNDLLDKPDQYIIEYHLNIGNDHSDLSQFLKIFEHAGYDYGLSAQRVVGKRFQDVLVHCYRRKPG